MPSSCKAYCGMVSSTIVPICPGKPFAFSLLRAFCLLSFDFCFVCFFFLRVFFFYDDDGEMWRTRTLFDDFLMKEILTGRSDDFLGTTNFLTIFLFEDLSGRRTSRYRRRPGFSPSMPLLVFWPHAGAWGAGVILPPCAQILWCRSLHKK